jgi:hypothetical protein
MELVCQAYHPQKATYYDLLGQVTFMLDKNNNSVELREKRAKENFKKAYLYRLITCGANAPVTIQAKKKTIQPSIDL